MAAPSKQKSYITEKTTAASTRFRKPVRIHGAKAPHPSTAAGDVAHQRLKQQIARRHVRLVVEESDPQGNLICYVRLAQRKAA